MHRLSTDGKVGPMMVWVGHANGLVDGIATRGDRLRAMHERLGELLWFVVAYVMLRRMHLGLEATMRHWMVSA